MTKKEVVPLAMFLLREITNLQSFEHRGCDDLEITEVKRDLNDFLRGQNLG